MIIVALVIVLSPVGLYFLMHHNHDNGHCGWNRCQAPTTKEVV